MAKSRQAVVNLVESWDGKKESNGSHKSIIDLYNDFFEKICAGKFPRGIRMRYDWAWCACTWSALAAALRYESIMPMEISCYYLIEAAKKMGCWQENDAYVPSPGDAILYDWQDNGISDNTGNPDHVGTVIEVYKESGYMVIEEGNYSSVVAFFTGNNDVDTFGEKLVPFGEAMKAYSEAIMGMDSAAITNSATAGKALVELANTIPNTGGLVSWFTGDNDLGSFGDSLVQFGSGIKSYSDSISGIDTGIMSSVITQVNRLVEMAKGMVELDTSGMSGFMDSHSGIVSSRNHRSSYLE